MKPLIHLFCFCAVIASFAAWSIHGAATASVEVSPQVQYEIDMDICIRDFREFKKVKGYSYEPYNKCQLILAGREVM